MKTEAVYGSMCVNEQLNREVDRLTAALHDTAAERNKLAEANERFKVMYQGFENQALAIMRYRVALEKILNEVGTSTLTHKIAREALEATQ